MLSPGCTVRLPPEPLSVRDARRHVTQVLVEAGREEWADDAGLAVSEMVTNVVLHARTDCELSVVVSDDDVRVSVRDFSPSLPTQRHFPQDATTGRGLALVARLSADFGVEVLGAEGKVVWFVLDGGSGAAGETEVFDDWDLVELLAQEDAGHGTSVAVLQHVPMALWLAGQEHQAAVLRELYLVRASPRVGEEPGTTGLDLTAAAAALRALSEATDRALEAAAAQPSLPRLAPLPEGHPSTMPAVPALLDLEVSVEGVAGSVFGAFQDALDRGQHLSRAGRLLVRPALDELVALRDWACDQVVAQLSGVLPTPWDQSANGPGADRIAGVPGYLRPDWDDEPVRTSVRAVVAADDSNRLIAISPAAAELLGAAAEDLVGRRITTIIPPRLREQHVAGFTRHLTTGQARVLGVELDLPLLRQDGQEVVRRFLIEQVPAPAGRHVYLAWLDPVPGA
jgi:PAS domain S-box-containing protein